MFYILFIVCNPRPHSPFVIGGRVTFQKVYIGGAQVKLGFLGRIGTLGGGDVFQVGLEKSMYKNSEYKSQTKKMILRPIFFLWGLNVFFFLHLVARSQENFKFLGDLISFLGEGDQTIYFHRAINDVSFKLKYSFGKIICFMCGHSNFFTFTREFLVCVYSVCSSVH